MDTITVYSYPNIGEFVDAGFTSNINLNNCIIHINVQDTSISSTLSYRNVWNLYDESDNNLMITSNDSNFHYSLQDTGWFRIELIPFTPMGCSDTLSRRFYVDSLFPKTTFYDTACFSYTWNDSIYYQSGTYYQTFQVNTCDSFVTLHLIVNPTFKYFDTISICDNELPFTYKDSVFTTAGNHSITYTSIYGCDSIYFLHLHTYPTFSHIDSISICSNEFPFYYKDSIYYSAGNYDINYTSQYGCDSIIYLVLQTNSIYHHSDTLSLCDNQLPYRYGDSTLHSAGNYQIYFSSIHGCDSLINLTLFVDSTYHHYDTLTLCNNKLPYRYGNNILTYAGNFNIYFSSSQGCDSLVLLTLYVNPSYHHYDTITLCYNELPYRYGDSILYAAGNYQIFFTSILGCDSLISLTLMVNPVYHHSDSLTLCADELPYHYGNDTLYAAGNYQIHFTTSLGCDSLISLALYVNPTYLYTDTLTVCDDDLPYYYEDSLFTQAGDYLIEHQSMQGCDSLISVNFNIKTKPATPLKIYGDTLITQAGNYTFYIDKVDEADSYQWTVSNSNWTGQSTTDTLHLSIPVAGTGNISVRAVNDCGISNTETINILSTVNIKALTSEQWSVGQNIPNPAQKTTIIPFRLPEAGNVSFSLMTINGQILFSKNIQASSGNNSFSYNISTLSNGIYFYAMSYKDQRIIRKMTVQH
ncbi:MAG: T9SS type A sorting domain-containing protein [Crenarchaeota archaeon]|nr:T9SS type A sorting domain-containing protein [Thermoproteota archaeon]